MFPLPEPEAPSPFAGSPAKEPTRSVAPRRTGPQGPERSGHHFAGSPVKESTPRRAAAHRSARTGAKRPPLRGFAREEATQSRRSAPVRKGRSETQAPGPQGSGASSGRPATAADTTEGFAPSTWRADRLMRSEFAPAASADRPGGAGAHAPRNTGAVGVRSGGVTAEPAQCFGAHAPRRQAQPEFAPAASPADPPVRRSSRFVARGVARREFRDAERRIAQTQRGSHLVASKRADDPQRR
jgi:hypothetical protein